MAAFLAGRIRYTDIAAACAETLARVASRPSGALDDALAADRDARDFARAWLKLPAEPATAAPHGVAA